MASYLSMSALSAAVLQKQALATKTCPKTVSDYAGLLQDISAWISNEGDTASGVTKYVNKMAEIDAACEYERYVNAKAAAPVKTAAPIVATIPAKSSSWLWLLGLGAGALILWGTKKKRR